jgi:dipeptidyl aminopeptidase/acylaminoacyl peptidase
MKMPLDGSAPAAQVALWDDSWQGPLVILESGDVMATVAPGDSYVRIPAAGGTPSQPAKFGLEGRTSGTTLVYGLPGDRGVFFVSTSYVGSVYAQGVGVLDLKTGKSKMLLSDAGSPRYSPTGHLLFSRHEAIFAVPFDLAKLEVKGTPTAILDGLRIPNAWMNGNFGMPLGSGTVVFPPGGFVGKERHLVAVDAEGKVTDWSGDRLPFEVGAIASPDGEQCLSVIATAGAIYEIWISERGRTAARRLIAKEGADVGLAIWSPDGRRVAYAQTGRTQEDGVYVMNVGGSAPPRRVAPYSGEVRYFPWAWTRDGSHLCLTRQERGVASACIVPVPLDGSTPPEPSNIFNQSSGIRANPNPSPDGSAIAYISDESGRIQVHVQAWSGTAPVGESVPLGIFDAQMMWSPDGKRVLAVDAAGRCLETTITRAPRLTASTPRELWSLRDLKLSQQIYSMLPDGRVLAVQQGEAEDDVRSMEVILNFPTLMKERLERAAAR